jgi:hypothetical protein
MGLPVWDPNLGAMREIAAKTKSEGNSLVAGDRMAPA